MHPLSNATTFQLSLVVDTLLAERHLLQLHASLASHMGGAYNPVQTWLEARRDETDASLVDVYRLAEDLALNGGEDERQHFAQIAQRAETIVRELWDMVDVGDLIDDHKLACGLDPNSDATATAFGEAEDALFAFRPATADQARARATYLLSDDALDLSCWDTEDLRTFLKSMV